MCRISIVIPVYNAERLISKCIESIINQSFDDFELIIIDDGSHDNSLNICNKFAQKDKRISVYHKNNGGQTSARKYGFKKSVGDFIYFVDADDFIPKDALSILYNKAVKYNLEIVDGASISYFEDGRIKEKVLFKKNGIFKQIDYLKLMFNDQANNGTHACLIKRTLFNENTFDISEDVKLGEDIFLHLSLVLEAQSFGIFNDYVYFYVLNKNSITHTYKYTSLEPVKIQIESIRKLLKKYNIFDTFSVYFYQQALSNLVSANLHNHDFINDIYNKQIANESNKVLKTFSTHLFCMFLKNPKLYYPFYILNALRKQTFKILRIKKHAS